MSEHCEQLCSLCSTNEQDEQLVFSLYIETRIRLSYKSCSTYLKSLLIVTLIHWITCEDLLNIRLPIVAISCYQMIACIV